MLLHRSIFINAMVRRLAQFVNSRDLSGFSSKREKPKLSGFLLERNSCIFGVLSRKLGLWNPPILMCGPEEIQLQVFTRNLRPRNELKEDTMQIRYAFVDAFIERPLAGNPVAIVPHAETLDEPTMRRIAGELNQVATTFILPPKNDFADWSLRSFTTAGLEFFGAGHNSLGAWWWLAESGNLMLGEGRNHFTQEIGGELLPVEVRCHHSQPVAVALTQMSPVYGAVCDDLPKLADALGVEDEDIMLSLPAQVVSTGIAHLLVPVIDREI